MARRSKREMPISGLPQKSEIYSVGIYLRLSVEEEKYKDGSESIENQRAIIYDYLQSKSDMKIYSEYCDNGETGTNFKREGFQRMMYDVYNGRVNCIIVKDLSRFGREYIETGEYMEKIFPLIGVRFIAINDNYDNHISAFDISVPIKNIINSVYARDISKKCAASLRIKQVNGEFIGTYAAYGYVKSRENNHKIEIDEDVAPVVKQIFEWKAEGRSYAFIIRELYKRKIMPPARYRYDNGIIKDKRAANQEFWNETTIKSMLCNEVYIGNLTQGRRKSFFFDGKKEEKVEKDDWIVVKGTHEPIISEELFYTVQNALLGIKDNYYSNFGKYDKISDNNNVFKGKLICGECGSNIARLKRAKEGYKKAVYVYTCRHHAIFREDCSFVSINEEKLKEIVLKSINMQIYSIVNFEKTLKAIENSPKVRKQKMKFAKSITEILTKISVIKSNRIRVVSDFAKGILSEDEYKPAKKEFERQLREETQRLEKVTKERDKLEKLFSGEKRIQELKAFSGRRKLTKEIVDIFVDRIKLYKDKRVEIKWSYNERQALFAQYCDGGINKCVKNM